MLSHYRWVVMCCTASATSRLVEATFGRVPSSWSMAMMMAAFTTFWYCHLAKPGVLFVSRGINRRPGFLVVGTDGQKPDSR